MTPTTVFRIKIADDANEISLLVRPCSLIFLLFIWGKKNTIYFQMSPPKPFKT